VTSALAARRATWLIVAVLTVGCSGETSPPSVAPTPTPTPSPSPTPADPANVAGTWTGTLESAGFAPRRITILAFQGGTCVDGAWRTEPAEWVGAISGYADVSSFSGSISFQRPADGPGKCGGVGEFSGAVGATQLRWTSTGFTGECSGGLPQSVTITLQRQ
jgi:hypothetical protein